MKTYLVQFMKHYVDNKGESIVSLMHGNSGLETHEFSTYKVAKSMADMYARIGVTGRVGSIDTNDNFINYLDFSFEGKISIIEKDSETGLLKVIEEIDPNLP